MVLYCEHMNVTPIFEWCSRKQPIVIDYPEDKLVLTAIRHNITGEYFNYDDLLQIGAEFNIPVVEAFRKTATDLKSFVKYVRGIENMEGYVIRFHSGHMVKLKGDEYCFIHNSKEAMAQEKDVIKLIMDNKVDDLLPKIDEADRRSLSEFQTLFHANINQYALKIKSEVDSHRDVYPTKKEFFMNFVKNLPRDEQSLYMRAYENQDVLASIMQQINLHTGSGPRVSEVRKFWGDVNWLEFRKPLDVELTVKGYLINLYKKVVDRIRQFWLVK